MAEPLARLAASEPQPWEKSASPPILNTYGWPAEVGTVTWKVPSTETTELGSVEPGRLTWPCRPITPPSVKLVPLNR